MRRTLTTVVLAGALVVASASTTNQYSIPPANPDPLVPLPAPERDPIESLPGPLVVSDTDTATSRQLPPEPVEVFDPCAEDEWGTVHNDLCLESLGYEPPYE